MIFSLSHYVNLGHLRIMLQRIFDYISSASAFRKQKLKVSITGDTSFSFLLNALYSIIIWQLRKKKFLQNGVIELQSSLLIISVLYQKVIFQKFSSVLFRCSFGGYWLCDEYNWWLFWYIILYRNQVKSLNIWIYYKRYVRYSFWCILLVDNKNITFDNLGIYVLLNFCVFCICDDVSWLSVFYLNINFIYILCNLIW